MSQILAAGSVTVAVDPRKLRRFRMTTPSPTGSGHMRQADLAEKAFISRSYLNEIESGRKDPSLRTAKLIASALGCPLDELIADQESQRRRLVPLSTLGSACDDRLPVIPMKLSVIPSSEWMDWRSQL